TSASFALSGSSTVCRYAIPEDLWLCDVDENQFGQVIDNLIINAQQAMPSGGTIQVKAVNRFIRKNEMPPLEPGEYVQIDIADSGIGMPSEMLEKIFDPFFTTKQKGSGLGLATCYSIISKHDGTISVVSTPGEGTVFSLYLPRSMNAAVQSRYEGKKSHSGTGRILVMDDEKIIREDA
ncbi:MAG: hybrid sensor histidine kinase/response regulator, partial [Spirochaetia bacterium]|nr:hybrid sensor histidine kinase/response regulator [Spirochaetia bacterium]